MPLNAAGVVILAYVAVLGREFDPWLRLIGVAALAQHAVAHFYAAIPRFYYLSWLLSGWLHRRYPDFCQRVAGASLSQKLVSRFVSPAKGVLLSKSRAAHGTLVSRNSSPSAGRAAAKYTKPRQGRQFAVGAMAPAHKAGRQA